MKLFQNLKWKQIRFVCITLLLLVVVIAIVWFINRDSFHPEFGRVYVTETRDSNNPWTRWQRIESTIRKILHLRKSQNDSDVGLRIGPNLIGWSRRGNIPVPDGYLYMNNISFGYPLWEFALTKKKRLADVTRKDLLCEFYGVNDAKATNAFGTDYHGHTLIVPEGQIFFARLTTNHDVIYVVRFVKQRGGAERATMRAEYVEVKN